MKIKRLLLPSSPFSLFRFLNVALLSASASANAAITATYAGVSGGDDATARTSFQSSVAGTLATDDFSTETNSRVLNAGGENTVGSGLFSVFYTTQNGSNNENIEISSSAPDFELGLGSIVSGTVGVTLLELRFPSPIIGFGADFIGLHSRNQANGGVSFIITDGNPPIPPSFEPGALLDPTNVSTSIDGFVGFISDTPFSTIRIAGGSTDFFEIDNVDVITVPEPGSTVLLGLVGLGVITRRQRV